MKKSMVILYQEGVANFLITVDCRRDDDQGTTAGGDGKSRVFM